MLKKFSAIIAICLIVTFFAIDKNQDQILLKKGLSCYEKNDIKCAQKNFEQAFALGVDDERARNAYVETIINTPLNIDSQKKALNFLAYNIEDSASLKLEYFLHDIKLEIFRNYPENYIKQTLYNNKVLRWGKMPITYNIISKEHPSENLLNEIEKAFSEWEKATDHEISFQKSQTNQNIIIKLENNNPANINSKKFVIAYTSPEIVSKELKKMQIIFYTTTPKGENLSLNQIYNTALHEIGHALGFMGHSNYPHNIMYMTKDSVSASIDSRQELTDADINTIKLLYQIEPEITNSKKTNSKYLPALVLGDDTERNLAKHKEAKNYIKNAPTIVAGYIDLAETYTIEKDYASAIKTLEKALNIANSEDSFEILYYNLAVLYHLIDHTELAKDYVLKSIQIKDTEDKRFLLAEIYKNSKEKNKAEQEYKNLFSNHPQNPDYAISLTNFYIQNKNYFKARSVLKTYFRQNPNEKANPRFKPYGILRAFL